VRATTLIRKLLGVTRAIVEGFRFEPDGLVVEVRPYKSKLRCGKCGKGPLCQHG